MKRSLFTTAVVVGISSFIFMACSQRMIGQPSPTTFVGPIPVYATIDLSCGDKTYTVSTGNNKGECQSSGQNAVCGDSGGNSTEVSCASGCMNAKGSASCTVKAQ